MSTVDIEPSELSFRRPFTVEVSQNLTITNSNTLPIAFKVKTTAPKQYCVRPNAGRIEPGQSFDVQVLLQAMKADPPTDAKCKDKFLVQSAPITSDKEFASIASILDTTDKSNVQEKKIRVTWLGSEHEIISGPSAPITNSVGSAEAISTPRRRSRLNGNATETPDAHNVYSSPSGISGASSARDANVYAEDQEPENEVQSEAPKSIVSQTTSTVTSAAQATYEELKAKLVEAEAQIASLRETGGLRQRNVKSPSGGNEKTSTPETAQTNKDMVEGIPVAIVTLLCVFSFLLAYFFF